MEDGEIDDSSCTSNNTLESTHVNCSCCNENFGEELMYECFVCHRNYHDYCHIPIILPSEKPKQAWKCTLCIEDMDTILKYEGDIENISVCPAGRKIAERILLELYCNTDGVDLFRECPNKNVFPRYYKNIVRAVALNDVRDSLINKKNYKLSEFVEDLKLVFVNAMSYFEVGSSNFNSARKLLTHLHSLYQSWILHSSRNK